MSLPLFSLAAVCFAASAADAATAPPEPPEEATAWATILDLRHRKEPAEALRAVEALRAKKLARGAPPHEIATAEQYIRSLTTILALPERERASASRADSLRPVIQGMLREGAFAPAESLLLRQLATRQAVLPGAYLEHAESFANLGAVRRMQGRLEDAEAPTRRAGEIWLELLGPRHPYVAAGHQSLGHLRALQGRNEEAIRLVRLGLSIYRATWGDDHNAVSGSWHDLAVLLAEVGEHDEAILIHQDNLAVRERLFGEESFAVSTTLHQLGQDQVAIGALDDAAESLARSLAIRERQRGPDHPATLVVRASLGELERRRGNLEEAERLLANVLAARRSALGATHPDVGRSLHALARVHKLRGALPLAAGEIAEAVRLLAAALGPGHTDVARSIRLQAEIALEQGESERALALLESAARSHEAARLEIGSGWRRATFAESPYPLLAHLLLRSGRGDDAWRAVERGTARALADLLAPARDRVEAEQAEQVAIEDRARRTRDLERAARNDASLAPAAEAARAELLEAEYAFFSRTHDAQASVAAGQVLDLTTIQRILPEDTAIIGWLDPSETDGARPEPAWGYVVRANGPVRWFSSERARAHASVDLADAPAPAFREALRSAAAWPFRVTDTARVDSLAHEVWRERFAPLEPHLRGVRDLLVVPSGGLQSTPLEALLDSTGTPLGARYRVSYVPSATVGAWLVREREAHATNRRTLLDRPALLVGDPISQDLPGSRREIAGLREEIPHATVLSGPSASDSVLLGMAEAGALREFGLLHVASHATVDPRSLHGSALVLDEPVTAQEILRSWSLDAELVVLSGCSTGLGRHVAGEGFVGFVQTFLQVGARAVLASLWDVDDRATALLMQRFYRALRADPTALAEALRTAREELRAYQDESGERPFRHPAYWAGFVLIGPTD